MKWKKTYSLLFLAVLLVACTAESLKDKLVRQEEAIETYIKRQIDSGEVSADSVFYNDGVYRLVYVSGVGRAAAAGDSVVFYYWASIFNTTQYYDSTRFQYPEKGILGAGNYMNGLEKGLVGMQAYEEAEILLTGAQAYGNVPVGILAPYTSIKFEIQMLNVVKNN